MTDLVREIFNADPFVSIVITSYNYDRYLVEAIDSALNQSYPHVEVIVVDDGSTDSSRHIIESFGSRCISVFRENGGEAAASFSGLQASRGDIVLFLDSDDLLDHDAIERIVAAWHPDCVKAQFYLRTIDPQKDALGSRMPNIDFLPDTENRKCLLHYGYYPSPPTSGNAYSRVFLLSVLPVTISAWQNGIDGYLNGLAPLHGEIASIPTELGSYRIHDRNMSAWNDLTLEKIRDGMLREIQRERVIVDHAASRGIQINRALVTNIPAHCKARILSLRLDGKSHPIQGDTLPTLLGLGLAAIFRFPHMTLFKRLGSSVGLVAMIMLPCRWLDRWLHALFITERRPRLSDLLPLISERSPKARSFLRLRHLAN